MDTVAFRDNIGTKFTPNCYIIDSYEIYVNNSDFQNVKKYTS